VIRFDKLRFTLRPDSRIGLLGRNGAGKSTLMKLLAGELQPLAGVREEGRNLKLGYFAQHQLEQLRPAESPLWHMIKLSRARASRTCATTSAASISAATWSTRPAAASPAARKRGWRWR
jgi:ATPase subunit of ABC transporter with duplicated ATPase domains